MKLQGLAGSLWRFLLPAMLIGATVVGCGSPRQTTYSGAMHPILTPPLTARESVKVLPPNDCQACAAPGYHGRMVARLVRPRQGAPGHHFSYPHVIDDPAKAGYQANSTWDMGSNAQATKLEPGIKNQAMGAILGNWHVVGAPNQCTVRLSGQALLDLRRASATGCAGLPIAKLTGWKQSGRAIELYIADQPTPTTLNRTDDGGLRGSGIELSRELGQSKR